MPRSCPINLETCSWPVHRNCICGVALVLMSGFGLCPSANAYFCNIPVFRFALERWQPDPYQLIVLTRGEFSDEDRQAFSELTDYARQHPDLCRVSQVSLDDDSIDDEMAKLTGQLKPGTRFPYLLVRTWVGRGHMAIPWQGSISEFHAEDFFDSPARKELAKRLLKGQSVVWLVVSSSNDQTTSELTARLSGTLAELQDEIPLPEGIGLPGSELFSSIPLSMKFSVLTIKRDDPSEKKLVDFLKQFRSEAFSEDVPLVVPVFGKARALEVVPGDLLDAGLIEDLTIFLSGACSCQVKDLNPGFDLPLAVDWNREIFGEDAVDLPPETGPGQQRGGPPQLVPIAPGNSGEKSDK